MDMQVSKKSLVTTDCVATNARWQTRLVRICAHCFTQRTTAAGALGCSSATHDSLASRPGHCSGSNSTAPSTACVVPYCVGTLGDARSTRSPSRPLRSDENEASVGPRWPLKSPTASTQPPAPSRWLYALAMRSSAWDMCEAFELPEA